jgi:hypothetical protein
MALPTSPLTQFITKTAAEVSAVSESANKSLPGILPESSTGFNFASLSAETADSKSKLDSLVAQKSGFVGTALNGATAGATGAFGNINAGELSGALTNFAGQAAGTVGAFAGSGGANLASAVAGFGATATAGIQTITGITGGIANGIATSGKDLVGGGLKSGLTSLGKSISAAAGQLGDLLSTLRGKNIPQGADLFEQTGSRVTITPSPADDWRVRINCDFKTLFGSPLFSRLISTGGVVWPYLPNITISTKANYTQVDPTHNNFPFQSYKNSQVEDITIAGDFSCETEDDAAYWIAATTFFRTATKMYYGQGQYAGNPPVICQLSGYGANIFNSVPIIIKSFSVDLKEDVNYIQCNTMGPTPTWVPIMSSISVTVAPIYNRERLRKFSLQNFAAGKEIGMI